MKRCLMEPIRRGVARITIRRDVARNVSTKGTPVIGNDVARITIRRGVARNASTRVPNPVRVRVR